MYEYFPRNDAKIFDISQNFAFSRNLAFSRKLNKKFLFNP